MKQNKWLFSVAKKLREWRELEAKQKEALAIFEAQVTRTKASIIGTAYSDGIIDGKNKETRDAQEAAVVAANSSYAQLVREYENDKGSLYTTVATRRYYEDLKEIGLALLGGKNE